MMGNKYLTIGVAALLSSGAMLSGCGYGSEQEELGTASSALLGRDTFLYAMCNATGWAPNDSTRLRPTADPYTFALEYEVKEPWMITGADNCTFAETNAYNAWGTTQTRFTARQPSLIAPAGSQLTTGGASFSVKYPATGKYTLTVNWRQGSFNIEATAPSTLEWPNAQSTTNGDAWLRANHDDITALKPRVLVVHANKLKSLAATQQMAQETAAAFREASRYHGYNDPNAPVTLDYQFQYTDLTVNDTASTDWPAAWPARIESNGCPSFDTARLFTPEFTTALNYRDPQNPSQVLSVCQLFERGIINELWTQVPRSRCDGNPVGVYEAVSRAQAYDAELNPIAGSFRNDAGNGWLNAPCGVTVRLMELLTTGDRGVGCTMEAAGHGFEGLASRGANPYLKANSDRFFNFELDERYQLPFDSQYDGFYCPGGIPDFTCYAYPSSNTLTLGNTGQDPDPRPGVNFTRWGEGCGNVHFPPNGRSNYDFHNTTQVLSTCENYALRNGSNGADAQTLYSTSLPAKARYDALYPDCASGWAIYLYQSMPGFGNRAIGHDNKPMKSWLPFMFY